MRLVTININVIGWNISSIMSADVSKLLKKIEADEVKFIRLQFSDVQGMPKNAAIPADQAEKSLTEGIWFDGSSIEGFLPDRRVRYAPQGRSGLLCGPSLETRGRQGRPVHLRCLYLRQQAFRRRPPVHPQEDRWPRPPRWATPSTPAPNLSFSSSTSLTGNRPHEFADHGAVISTSRRTTRQKTSAGRSSSH